MSLKKRKGEAGMQSENSGVEGGGREGGKLACMEDLQKASGNQLSRAVGDITAWRSPYHPPFIPIKLLVFHLTVGWVMAVSCFQKSSSPSLSAVA